MSRAKKPAPSPVPATETTHVLADTSALDQWRARVWAGQTYGAAGEEKPITNAHPLVVHVWQEDVMAKLTDLSLAQWMKNQQ